MPVLSIPNTTLIPRPLTLLRLPSEVRLSIFASLFSDLHGIKFHGWSAPSNLPGAFINRPDLALFSVSHQIRDEAIEEFRKRLGEMLIKFEFTPPGRGDKEEAAKMVPDGQRSYALYFFEEFGKDVKNVGFCGCDGGEINLEWFPNLEVLHLTRLFKPDRSGKVEKKDVEMSGDGKELDEKWVLKKWDQVKEEYMEGWGESMMRSWGLWG